MSFVVLPDRPTSPTVLEQVKSVVGDTVLTYPSGRPWVVSSADVPWSELEISPTARVISVQRPLDDLSAASLAGREIGHQNWDDAAARISISSHFVACVDGVTRLQGNLSGSCQFFWAEVRNLPIVSDSPAVLRALTGAEVDRAGLALALGKSMPILPFAERTAWAGITSVGIGRWLRLSGDGAPATERWWSPSDRPKLPFGEAAAGVRAALREVLGELAGPEGLVSADLSGGLDSTSICYALGDLGQKFLTFRTSSTDVWNDESERARAAAGELGVDVVEFPPLSENSTAFTMELDADPATLAEGPMVWSASRGYLDVLAPAIHDAGSRVHFTGLGGDELFDIVPGVYRSIWNERGLGALRRLRRHQLSNKVPLGPFMAGVTDRSSYGDHLRAVTAALATGRPPKPSDAYSWFPPPSLPKWLTEKGRALVVEAFEEAAGRGLAPLGADPAAHQVIESISYQGRIIRQFGVAYARYAIAWQAPFTDRRVVEAVLRAPMSVRVHDQVDKPLLAETVSPFMPRQIFAKRGRGDFTADIYAEHHRRKKDLIGQFATSRLADLGLVEVSRLLPYLESPSLADVGLLELEKVIVAERWLRSIT